MWRRITLFCGIPLLFLAVMVMTSCTPAPPVQPLPEPAAKPTPPSVSPGFKMKPYHRDMSTEMRNSYERADEIVIGEFSGSRKDEQIGLLYYIDNFITFDKTTLSWGPETKVIMEVWPQAFIPEIIGRREFNRLSALDKVGICWDYFEETRYIYLVEGQKMLLFLEVGYNEANNTSLRSLIDAYPVTRDCNAKDVFNLMLRDR